MLKCSRRDLPYCGGITLMKQRPPRHQIQTGNFFSPQDRFALVHLVFMSERAGVFLDVKERGGVKWGEWKRETKTHGAATLELAFTSWTVIVWLSLPHWATDASVYDNVDKITSMLDNGTCHSMSRLFGYGEMLRRNLGDEPRESVCTIDIKHMITCWKLHVISNPSWIIRHYTCGKLYVIFNPLYVIRHFIWIRIGKGYVNLFFSFLFFLSETLFIKCT